MKRWPVVAALFVLALVSACSPRAKELKLETVPYTDGERARYAIMQDGRQVGGATFLVTEGSKAGEHVWKLEHATEVGDYRERTSVFVRREDLTPVATESELDVPSKGRFFIESAYENRKTLRIAAQTPTGLQKFERGIWKYVYDNDQILYTIRALPLGEGYRAEFMLILPKNVTRVASSVAVVARERVEVPAGTFETYKVSLTASAAPQYAWYRVDGAREMVLYDNGKTRFELVEFGR